MSKDYYDIPRSQAEDEGYAAGLLGMSKSENPYSSLTHIKKWWAWRSGWTQGHRDLMSTEDGAWDED